MCVCARARVFQVNVESALKTWVYNKLIELSKVYVREKIQSELLKSLDEKTGILMETLNELTEEYWPLLLSIADTSAGMRPLMIALIRAHLTCSGLAVDLSQIFIP